MVEDVQESKGDDSYIISIYLKEDLVWIGGVGLIGEMRFYIIKEIGNVGESFNNLTIKVSSFLPTAMASTGPRE